MIQPYLLNTCDISAKPKTAENLLEIVLSEITYAVEVLKVKVVAWCTDAGGDSAKMLVLPKSGSVWFLGAFCRTQNRTFGPVQARRRTLDRTIYEVRFTFRTGSNHQKSHFN